MAASAAFKQLQEERDQLRGKIMRLEADLTAKETDYDTVQEYRAEERAKIDLLQAEIRNFNGILDKIVRVSNGSPMNKNNDSAWATGGANFMSGEEEKMSLKRRQAIELLNLHHTNNVIESRLAAVRAMAEFAKDHKA